MFTKTLSPTAQNSLALLGKSRLLKNAYLAGGSALALHLGHRHSLDFDFFSRKHFKARELTVKLMKLGKFEKSTLQLDTLLGTFNSVKFSLFYLEYPLIKKVKPFLKISLASTADIAAMKLAALVDRGTKRDFIDLYFLIKEKYNSETIFNFYNKKYQKLSENSYSILKALKYFEDAEESEMPKMIKKVSWEEVKRFFEKEIKKLAKKYL